MRLTLALAAASIVLLAAPAVAQPTAFNCQSSGAAVNCQETAGSQAERMTREALARSQAESRARMERPSAAAVDIGALRARRQAEEEAAHEKGWRRRVGNAINDGQCDDARRIALENGNFDVAEQVMRICKPAP